jgi:micrococcal nuclease
MAASVWLLATLLVLGSCAPDPGTGSSPPRASTSPVVRASARVIRVVDGDTIHVDLDGDDVTIRLIGIDTPEVDTSFTERECFGARASAYTHAALDGQQVELEFDVERLDRYDRTLAYVWRGDELFNERIVRDGFALVATFPPNAKYVDRFLAAERTARDAGSGLWSACR